jgi:hypothetical protein
MKEKRHDSNRFRLSSLFAFIAALAIVLGLMRPWEKRPDKGPGHIPDPTRWGEFYVGMPYEEAKLLLPEDEELKGLEILYEGGPKPGDIFQWVEGEDHRGKFWLFFDKSLHVVRIGVERQYLEKTDLRRSYFSDSAFGRE